MAKVLSSLPLRRTDGTVSTMLRLAGLPDAGRLHAHPTPERDGTVAPVGPRKHAERSACSSRPAVLLVPCRAMLRNAVPGSREHRPQVPRRMNRDRAAAKSRRTSGWPGSTARIAAAGAAKSISQWTRHPAMSARWSPPPAAKATAHSSEKRFRSSFPASPPRRNFSARSRSARKWTPSPASCRRMGRRPSGPNRWRRDGQLRAPLAAPPARAGAVRRSRRAAAWGARAFFRSCRRMRHRSKRRWRRQSCPRSHPQERPPVKGGLPGRARRARHSAGHPAPQPPSPDFRGATGATVPARSGSGGPAAKAAGGSRPG